MTTDFFITLQQNGELIDVARTIKRKDDLLDRRVMKKFGVERIYWHRKGVSWATVTEADIDKVIAKKHNVF